MHNMIAQNITDELVSDTTNKLEILDEAILDFIRDIDEEHAFAKEILKQMQQPLN